MGQAAGRFLTGIVSGERESFGEGLSSVRCSLALSPMGQAAGWFLTRIVSGEEESFDGRAAPSRPRESSERDLERDLERDPDRDPDPDPERPSKKAPAATTMWSDVAPAL